MREYDLWKRLRTASRIEGEVTLSSGEKSSVYYEKFGFLSDPVLLSQIVVRMTSLLPPETEVVAGPELGGAVLATGVSLHSNLPLAILRREPKQYGNRSQIEGAKVKGRKVCVIEDIVTTAGQLIKAVKLLRAEGAQIVSVQCVIERAGSAARNCREAGVELQPLFRVGE